MIKTPFEQYMKLLPEEDSYLRIRQLLDDHPELLSPQLLFYAVVTNQIDVVMVLLHRGVDVNAVDQNGCTALHYSARDKAKDLTKFLLQKGAKQVADKQGETPFQIALKNSELEILSICLEDYDADYDLESIRQIITNQKFPEKIRFGAYLYLIARGELTDLQKLADLADLTCRDSKGNNAVLIAIRSGRADVLSWLLSVGLSLDVSNDDKEGPVLMAVAANRCELLDLLVKPAYLCGYGLSLKPIEGGALGAVRTAVAYGAFEVLKQLLKDKNEGGYGLTLKVSQKSTDVMTIAVKFGQTKMFAKLVKPVDQGGYGLDLNDAVLPPVLTAIKYGREKILAELIKPTSEGGYGLSLDCKDSYDQDVIHYSIFSSSTELFADFVRPRSKKGYGLSIYFRDNEGIDAVLMAVALGSLKFLKEFIAPINCGGYGLSIRSVDLSQNNAVLIAAWYNQKEMLDYLVKPEAEKGCGLSLDIKNNTNMDVVMSAVRHVSLFRDLVKPKAAGGYGCSLEGKKTTGLDVVGLAHFHNCTELLIDLLKPISQGGYGRPLVLIHGNFTSDNQEASVALFMCNVNAWLTAGIESGLQTFRENYAKLKFVPQELNSTLIIKFRELLEFSLNTNQIDDAKKIVEALTELAPEKANMIFCTIYAQHRDFVVAYQNYLEVYQNAQPSETLDAGFEIANMIFVGDIVLTSTGELDEQETVQGSNLNILDLEFRKLQGKNLEIMQDRAIKAYEYLHNNKSTKAAALRDRLDSVLSGNLLPSDDKVLWHPEILLKFQAYYVQRNPALLASVWFVNSFKKIMLRVIALEEKASEKPANYSPRFLSVSTLPRVEGVVGVVAQRGLALK